LHENSMQNLRLRQEIRANSRKSNHAIHLLPEKHIIGIIMLFAHHVPDNDVIIIKRAHVS
jgi:hypothetical protein